MDVFFLIFLLGYIAWGDIANRRIKNTSIIFSFSLMCFLKFFQESGIDVVSINDSLISFCVYFFSFLVFYKLNWMGGGDVKLGAVLAFFFGVQDFFVVWLISIALALGYVVLVKIAYIAGWEVFRQRLTFKDVGQKYVPYGALLCFASMFYILRMEGIL